MDPDPLTTLFGIKGFDLVLTSLQHNMILFVTLLARRLILVNWKQTQAPAHSALVTDVMHHLHLDESLIRRM